jgi:hypothetical protein
MKKGAQELPADRSLTAAANEEFSGGIAGAVREPEPVKSGWDPYEVWATRVKPARRKRERQRDPLSQG